LQLKGLVENRYAKEPAQPSRRRAAGHVKKITMRSKMAGTVKTMKGMRSGVSMMVFPPEKLCPAATTDA
jgi:hypothetical protein